MFFEFSVASLSPSPSTNEGVVTINCETNVVGETSQVNSTTPANAIHATAHADGSSLSIVGRNTGGADRIACLRCCLDSLLILDEDDGVALALVNV